MDMSSKTNRLVSKVLAVNPNTAVVVQSGTPVTMPWIDNANAICHAWYGGNETGNAIADVLFGDVNPVRLQNSLQKIHLNSMIIVRQAIPHDSSSTAR
jgi:hypothetical protein